MKYKIFLGIVFIAILAAGTQLFLVSRKKASMQAFAKDYKNATYEIDGSLVALVNGKAETGSAFGSASKVVIQYFGNEGVGDLNGDGTSDVVFLLTQSGGGTGTFYYAVAALKTAEGYKGTNAILLGDRIAPQTTELHDREIVINYAERKPGDSMTISPSIGVSKYLKIENEKLMEMIKQGGETPRLQESGISGMVLLGPTCPVMRDPPEVQCADKLFKTSLVLTTPDGVRVIKEFSSDVGGKFKVSIPPGEYAIWSAAAAHTLPYCSSNGTIKVVDSEKYASVVVHCDTGIR